MVAARDGGPAAAFAHELRASVDRTLLAEARRNELTIAHVRAIALGFVAALDLLLHLQPPGFRLPYAFSGLNALLAAAWWLAALVLVGALRRGWYDPRLRLALPLADGAMLGSLFACILLTADDAAYVRPAVVNIGIACALFALSGALRLQRSAAWLTTGLAVATFSAIALLAGNPPPETVFGSFLLVGAGFLGVWMSDIARRSVQSEVGRLVLGRFLPPDLVRDAHQQPLDAVTQARRLVGTVLVTDLRGFTAQAERMPPESVLEQLNRVQGLLAEVVRAHGGQVDKFMGDGMLAVFGMASPGAPHAAQAVAAAHEMLARLPGVAGDDARIGIGIHTGPLVAGCLGSGLRLEFTVLGDTVNTAARLQDMTKDHHVTLLASAAAAQAAGAAIRWRRLGAVAVRGRQAQLEICTPDD